MKYPLAQCANDGLVYHLSAQFPGPTTPRDFVTLLMTSDSALGCSEKQQFPPFSDNPKHFMIVSKPCIHPECPPRDGFIRGQYESVEFIREVHRKPKRSASAAELLKAGYETDKDGETSVDRSVSSDSKEHDRRRSQTISSADPRAAKNEGKPVDTTSGDSEADTEIDPVEWIMITRSDPGGSVPRFMVERGTPGSIVADASKFLDWACKKDHDVSAPPTEGATSSDFDDSATNLESAQTNGDLAGLNGPTATNETPSLQEPAVESTGLLSTMTSFAKAGVETYAPRALADRLYTDQPAPSTERDASLRAEIEEADDTSTISSMSFASAEEGIEDDASVNSSSSIRHQDSPDQSRHEKELARLQDRKKTLDEKLAKSREKELKDKEELTSKEQDRLRKAEEKHKREIEKQEQKHKKEIAKLEAKRLKETAKEEARRRREQDKDEKTRLTREKDELKQELEVTRQEREIFRDQVGALQRENTSLVARLGKLIDGKSVLKEVQAEVASGTRSRSSSIRRSKETTGNGVEATVLAGERKEPALK